MLPAMSVGDWSGVLTAARRAPFLSLEEEHALARRSNRGDSRAMYWLVLSHLRFVVRIARGYRNSGLPMADLVQEGTIGLIQAVRRFNPDQGTRFATYAMWWIRAAIQEHVVRSWSLVRVGTTAAQKALFLAIRRRGTGEMPDAIARRLAERFGVGLSDVRDLARRAFAPDRSLHEPAGDGRRQFRLDQIEDGRPSPEEDVERASQTRFWHGLLARSLGALPPREQTIIRRRYLSDAKTTFDALSRELGLSKERVRQLESIALDKLRATLAIARGGEELPG
jgi:RNA polymerase sigma-32 factor